jgi:penicillin-insensitive murein endopeptidase
MAERHVGDRSGAQSDEALVTANGGFGHAGVRDRGAAIHMADRWRPELIRLSGRPRPAGTLRVAAGLAGALFLSCLAAQPATAAERAKDLFGAVALPSVSAPKSIGFYAKGCISGAVALPLDGPAWQVMRPSRNRFWGHPAMVALIERLSRDAVAAGWPGLLVGDIGMPRGGPMPSGHASHQVGLDADIWFTPMPDRTLANKERETMAARSLLKGGKLMVDDRLWTPAYAGLLRQAASYPEVERIFVNPAIKKKLCDTVTGDRSWMNKIRPFWGHDEHFHIRIGCQPGSPGCKAQEGTGSGDGCDKSLAWWFTPEPWRPSKNPEAPKARDLMTMADLPKECRAVLDAPGAVSVAAVTYRGGPWPRGPAPAMAQAAPAPAQTASAGGSETVPAAAAAFAETPDINIPLPRPRPGG